MLVEFPDNLVLISHRIILVFYKGDTQELIIHERSHHCEKISRTPVSQENAQEVQFTILLLR